MTVERPPSFIYSSPTRTARMRTPLARQALANLALTYIRLARHAALREASETGEQNALPEQDRIQTD
jgi:hypothetical protein